VAFVGLLETALYALLMRFHGMKHPYRCMVGEMMQNGMVHAVCHI
jgi:hypothetical protein